MLSSAFSSHTFIDRSWHRFLINNCYYTIFAEPESGESNAFNFYRDAVSFELVFEFTQKLGERREASQPATFFSTKKYIFLHPPRKKYSKKEMLFFLCLLWFLLQALNYSQFFSVYWHVSNRKNKMNYERHGFSFPSRNSHRDWKYSQWDSQR